MFRTLWLNQKKKVYIVDNLSTGYKLLINKNAKFYKSNINNTKIIKKIIKVEKIDSIIHMAASSSVSDSKKNYKLF